MNKKVSTRDKVHQIADDLLYQGIRPTQQNVREQLGTGSLTTINGALHDWWKSLADRLTLRQTHADLPEAVLSAANKLWDEALANADHRYQQLISETHAAANEQREADIDEMLALKQQLTEQQVHYHELMARYDSAVAESALSQRQLLEAEAALIKSNAQVVDLERQLKQTVVIQQNMPTPPVASDEVFELKVDLQIKEIKIKELSDLLKKRDDEYAQLVQTLKTTEIEALKQQHRLELVIAQQDTRYEEMQTALADCKKMRSLAKSKP